MLIIINSKVLQKKYNYSSNSNNVKKKQKKKLKIKLNRRYNSNNNNIKLKNLYFRNSRFLYKIKIKFYLNPSLAHNKFNKMV